MMDNFNRRRKSVPKTSFRAVTKMMMAQGMKSGKAEHIEPLHAALSKDMDEAQMSTGSEESLIRNRALLHYIATLANSNSETDTFSYNFVQSLIDGGGNLNEAIDTFGQTIFHEVARSWNLDVARFLISNGADVNQQDKYGRSPLHVSAAADHCDMVEFLLQNGADIDSMSKGDDQTPLHFAAKNDATRSLHALLGFGANIDSLDSKGRTALQVASELSRSESVRVLIGEGASSCIYDVNGNSAMTVLIEKLPNLAVEALDQIHLSDHITRSDLFYLNLLEESRQQKKTKNALTPLETAVKNRQFDVIMHPVMQRLITVKWLRYGRFGTILDLSINFVYAMLLTIFAIGTPNNGKDLYYPLRSQVWRLFVGSIIIAMTSYQMYLQIKTTYKSREKQKSWMKWRLKQLNDDLQYCHPKWQEEKYVREEMKIIKNLPLLSTIDSWFYFDWLIIIIILVSIGLNFSYYFGNTPSIKSAYLRVLSILLILVWLRILKYLRPFPEIGTLVLILGSTGGDFLNWGFFFMLLFVPFTCCFWIIFGGSSYNKVEWFSKSPRIIYTMFQISVGEDYNIQGLVEADHIMARLLSVLFITSMVIVCLNILIAYLSNTFTRVYSKAVENTNMQRAINVLNVEKFLTKKRLRKFYDHLRRNANPDIVPWSPTIALDKRVERKAVEELEGNFRKTNQILTQRFQKQVGKGPQSTFDILLDNVQKIKSHQMDTVKDLMKIQTDLEDLGEVLKVDTSMKFNFSELVYRMMMGTRDRTASTISLGGRPRSSTTSSTFNSWTNNVQENGHCPGTRRKNICVKVEGEYEYEEEREKEAKETDEEDLKGNRSKRKSLLSKLTKLKSSKESETEEEEEMKENEVDDEEKQDDKKKRKKGVLSRLQKLQTVKHDDSEDEKEVERKEKTREDKQRRKSAHSRLTKSEYSKQREEMSDRTDNEVKEENHKQTKTRKKKVIARFAKAKSVKQDDLVGEMKNENGQDEKVKYKENKPRQRGSLSNVTKYKAVKQRREMNDSEIEEEVEKGKEMHRGNKTRRRSLIDILTHSKHSKRNKFEENRKEKKSGGTKTKKDVKIKKQLDDSDDYDDDDLDDDIDDDDIDNDNDYDNNDKKEDHVAQYKTKRKTSLPRLVKSQFLKQNKRKKQKNEETEDEDEEIEEKEEEEEDEEDYKEEEEKKGEDISETDLFEEDIDDSDNERALSWRQNNIEKKKGETSKALSKGSMMKHEEKLTPSKNVHFREKGKNEGLRDYSNRFDKEQYQARNLRFQLEEPRGLRPRSQRMGRMDNDPPHSLVPYHGPSSQSNYGFSDESLDEGVPDNQGNFDAWEKISIDSVSL